MKKILLMFVAALSMALASCSGALEPTGDVNKDAASLGEKMISMLQGVKSFDDIAKLNIDLTSLQQKFIEFYKSKGEEESQHQPQVEQCTYHHENVIVVNDAFAYCVQ